MGNSYERFCAIPGRLLLDTCVINCIYDNGEYIFEGYLEEGETEEELDADLRALRLIFDVNERASFQFVISPVSIAELAAIPGFYARERKLRWALDAMDCWQIAVWETRDGTVRQRRFLPADLVEIENHLLKITDFKRSPYDRLLLLETGLANCDAFLTIDKRTILKHREFLSEIGIKVITPLEFWDELKPFAALWK